MTGQGNEGPGCGCIIHVASKVPSDGGRMAVERKTMRQGHKSRVSEARGSVLGKG